jgi:histidinol-phosphatase (PHP family)
MLPRVDYHMHTPLCGHAVGEPREYVAQAIRRGLAEIGFSDHAPLVTHDEPRYTMNHAQLPEYLRMMEAVRKEHREYPIKIGIEADYVPGFESRTRALLATYPYDFVIGSVHFIDAWAFDDPGEQVRWKDKDVDVVYRDYYALLRRSAESGLFDVMGHVDLVKKFGQRPQADLRADMEATARVFHETGVTVEVNTSGLRKPANEIYPALGALTTYRQAGVPITFGSDAHEPGDVGRDFDKARTHALAAGYREYRVFKARQVERVEAL